MVKARLARWDSGKTYRLVCKSAEKGMPGSKIEEMDKLV
jgi:hypothetical protein